MSTTRAVNLLRRPAKEIRRTLKTVSSPDALAALERQERAGLARATVLAQIARHRAAAMRRGA